MRATKIKQEEGMSKRSTVFVKMIALTLSIMLFAAPLMAQSIDNAAVAQSQELDFEMIRVQAEADAQADAGGAIGYAVGGFLCGIFGWILAATSSVKVPADRVLGKEPGYVMAYSDVYESKVKSIRKKSACTGWVLGSTISLLMMSTSSGT